MAMGRVSGKVAVVTGAGSGQGAAEADLLAQEGAKVIATDINFDNVQKVVEEINAQHPGSALAKRHDVSSKEEWTTIVDAGVSQPSNSSLS
jgi:NADP-dependent 3-hydroxy acid dehydrogenase YdfG